MTITFRLVPNAGAGFMTVYADGSTRDESTEVGFGGPDGVFSHTWTVGADIPTGEGKVNAFAYDGAAHRGGTKVLPFKVVLKGQPC